MASSRPYESVEDLRAAATEEWWLLQEEEWLVAFASHPAIGQSKSPSAGKATARWSSDEQSGARGADDRILRRLEQANLEYLELFGFTFIICATGRSASEMLSHLEQRLDNPRDVEIRVAAVEQAQITQIRITKLLAELEEEANHG